MKILMVTDKYLPNVGGVINTIREISENLVGTGNEVTIVCFGNQNKTDFINGVKIFFIKSQLSKYFLGLSFPILVKINSIIKEENPDIVHIHGYHTLLSLSALIPLKTGINIVFSPHYHKVGHTPLNNLLHHGYKYIGYVLFKKSRIIFTGSHYEKELVTTNFPNFQRKVVLVPLGVKKIIISEKKQTNLDRKRINLLFIGNLMEYKGIQYIIKSLSYLIKKGYCPHLTIIGNGSYKSDLVSLIEVENVGSNINFFEKLSDHEIELKMLDSDMLLLLSKAEAYGLVVAESLGLGTPTIVSNANALKEFTEIPGCFGIDIPPRIDDLADLIINTFNYSGPVGPADKTKIRTWDEVASNYFFIYERIKFGAR
ncbi:MAG: putative glycosyl transferase [Methanomassiliicoccales archaeon PtaU1.Bin124]|nr:MAG: putative glycosyl transferase [Methanomassiliicoccales archaeon PtaU1.Bin124]